MLKLYGVARSRASRNIWALDELGLDYQLVPVIQAYRLADPAAPCAAATRCRRSSWRWRRRGWCRCCRTTIWCWRESLAINLYLAKKAGGPLAPRDAAEEALMVASALYAVASVEPAALASMYVYAQGRADTPEGQAELAAMQRTAGAAAGGDRGADRRRMAIRSAAASPSPTSTWPRCCAMPRRMRRCWPPCPAIRAWLADCQARPAFKAMMAAREAEPV